MLTSEPPGELDTVAENLDYFEAVYATVTVTAKKPRKIASTDLPFYKTKRWTGTIGEEFLLKPLHYGEFGYSLLYREDGFEDYVNPKNWDFEVSIDTEGERLKFSSGDVEHSDWEFRRVEVDPDV